MPEDPNTPPPATPPAPPADDLKKKLEDSESKLKEQSQQISELQTTIQTINKRFETNPVAPVQGGDDDEKELSEIENMRAYDPDGASKRMSQYLKQRDERIATKAVTKATEHITAKQTINDLRNGVKSSNPQFSDEIVNVVMQRAEQIASSGKVKTAVEAVNEAAKFVKAELDAYASKAHAVPPLPSGAGAEGGNNPPPAPPTVEKVETPADFLESSVAAKQKRIL